MIQNMKVKSRVASSHFQYKLYFWFFYVFPGITTAVRQYLTLPKIFATATRIWPIQRMIFHIGTILTPIPTPTPTPTHTTIHTTLLWTLFHPVITLQKHHSPIVKMMLWIVIFIILFIVVCRKMITDVCTKDRHRRFIVKTLKVTMTEKLKKIKTISKD